MNTRVSLGGLASAVPVLAVCMATCGSAAAQLPDASADCAAIENDTQRLACYDEALRPAAPPPPVETNEPVAPPQPDTAADARAPADGSAATPPAAEVATAAGEEPETESRRSRRRESERPVQSVVIDSVTENFAGWAFTTDTGEVYVQTSTRSPRYPDPPFSARLEPASFGSFFLIPENESNRIRVSLRE